MNSDALSWQFDHARDIIPSRISPQYANLVCKELAGGGHLTPEAERNAFMKLRALKEAGKDEEYLDTFGLILKYNMGLVFKAVNMYKNNNRGISVEELISEGTLILVRSIKGYDPSYSNKFCTYCYMGIVRAISTACQRSKEMVYQEIDGLDNISPYNHNGAENIRLSDIRNQIQKLATILSERDRKLLFEYYGITKTNDKYDRLTQGKRRRRVHLILRILQLHVKNQLIEKCV
jgi:RNA polymerase sigma factor (sigma-70 family)